MPDESCDLRVKPTEVLTETGAKHIAPSRHSRTQSRPGRTFAVQPDVKGLLT